MVGASKPRNTGLDYCSGEYIVFIDSDDMVSENYIATILEKINSSEFDYCLIGWKYIGERDDEYILTNETIPDWNMSVWNCIYAKSLIGDKRFNENMRIGEDGDFNDRVRAGKSTNIPEILYYYRDGRCGSIMNSER